MAKYRRYYRRNYKKKGTWSSRIQNFSGSQSAAAQANYIISYTLCTNPDQSSSSVSNKYTVKNMNCQIQLNSSINPALVDNLQAFICYVPQGFIPTDYNSRYADLPYEHPEWIMAHKFYGTANASTPNFAPLRLSSRLARKLDTGDKIVLIIIGTNTNVASSSITLDYSGVVKYVTRAN